MRQVIKNGDKLLFRDIAHDVSATQSNDFESLFTPAAVHELLFTPKRGHGSPLFPALLAAKHALSTATNRKLAWVDSAGELYPPAVIQTGIAPQQLFLLRPKPADVVWTTIETLRCRSMAAVIALMTQPLSRVEVRRLQLAAECGGGIALLIRPNVSTSRIYAAATRWLVQPTPGERTIQRWRLQLIHGHGRHIGQTFLLEKNRATGQTHFVHLPPAVGDHPSVSAAS